MTTAPFLRRTKSLGATSGGTLLGGSAGAHGELLAESEETTPVSFERRERNDRATSSAERSEHAERGERVERVERGERAERGERGERAERGARPERSGDRRERSFVQQPSAEPAPPAEGPNDDLLSVVESLLRAQGRAGAVGLRQVADQAQRRKLDPAAANPGTIALACQTDNTRRMALGLSPRFRLDGNRVLLSPWALDGAASELERQLEQLLPKYAESVERQLQRRLRELAPRAAGDLACALLEALGFTELTAVKRQNAHQAELHLAARPPGDTSKSRVAIVVRRDGREIGRERVIDLRGALHHYGPAHSGLLLTAGQILSGAREEASHPSAAAVQLWDGAYWARLCLDKGIGVVRRQIALPALDTELFDALR
jgi:restriction endonuclease Mrr